VYKYWARRDVGLRALLGGTYYFTEKSFWERGVTDSPLCRRAWVLQERVLAPRTIHFGEQLFFECQKCQACETFPRGLPRDLIPSQALRDNLSIPFIPSDSDGATIISRIFAHPQKLYRRLSAGKSTSASQSEEHSSIYTIWRNLVRTYSACKLSYKLG
jgi:hypothetical protein